MSHCLFTLRVAAIFSRASNPNKDQKTDFKDAFQNPPRFLHLQQLRRLRIKFPTAYKRSMAFKP